MLLRYPAPVSCAADDSIDLRRSSGEPISRRAGGGGTIGPHSGGSAFSIGGRASSDGRLEGLCAGRMLLAGLLEILMHALPYVVAIAGLFRWGVCWGAGSRSTRVARTKHTCCLGPSELSFFSGLSMQIPPR